MYQLITAATINFRWKYVDAATNRDFYIKIVYKV